MPRKRKAKAKAKAKAIRFVAFAGVEDEIGVALAYEGDDQDVRSVLTIPNRRDALGALVRRLRPLPNLRVCAQAGPTGYSIYWQLAALGLPCALLKSAVDGRRTLPSPEAVAVELMRSYRRGSIPVWSPVAAEAALQRLLRVMARDERAAPAKDQPAAGQVPKGPAPRNSNGGTARSQAIAKEAPGGWPRGSRGHRSSAGP